LSSHSRWAALTRGSGAVDETVEPGAARPADGTHEALDIFNRSDDLRTIYLLRHPVDSVGDLTEGEAGRFLLWMVAFGRKLYHGIVIASDVFDYVTRPVDDYLSRLEHFADTSRNSPVSGTRRHISQVHRWYYTQGVRELNLEIFVTPRELAALDGMSPSSERAGATLLDEILRAIESERGSRLETGSGIRAACRAHTAQPASPLPWPTSPVRWCSSRSTGVNLIGYANAVLGVGEDVRSAAQGLGRAGIPFAILNVPLPDSVTSSLPTDLSAFFVDRPIFPVNLFCMTMFETERMRVEFGANMFGGRYNIGYWPWELPTVSPQWRHAFDHIDEVWAISEYLADVYTRCTDKPVAVMPPCVAPGPVEAFDLSSLGVEPGTFVFLAMLDFNSFMSRKNPIGAIQAFRRAFPRENGVERLVIKTINGQAHSHDFDRLLSTAEADPRIVVVDGVFSRAVTNGLIAAADCLVSLHRAEGLGRTIAEAMLLETPVVATNWSGSTSLMDEATGFPVDYSLRPVPSGDYVFATDSRWAEPSIDDAARQLRIVRETPVLRGRKCSAAKVRVAHSYGPDAVGARMADRLGRIAAGH